MTTADGAQGGASLRPDEMWKSVAAMSHQGPGAAMQATGVILCLAASGFRFEWFTDRQLTELEFITVFLGGIVMIAFGALVTLTHYRMSETAAFELKMLNYQHKLELLRSVDDGDGDGAAGNGHTDVNADLDLLGGPPLRAGWFRTRGR